MLSYDILEKDLGKASPPHFVYDFYDKYLSCYILLTDEFSVLYCFYFLRYWSVCVLQMFVTRL